MSNAFTAPRQSFAVALQRARASQAGGAAAARKARGVAVPSLTNGRGVQTLRKPT